MHRFPILDICARIEGHQVQHALLQQYCRSFTNWEELLHLAEKEGMTPLLKKHLDESGSEYPLAVRRSLHLLRKRHQHKTEVRIKVLQEILSLFEQHALAAILLKGAALAHTLYPDPVLRPMRDIDILLAKEAAEVAQALLVNNGFMPAESPIPSDHFHLPSLLKEVDGVQICVELHRGLYPNCPPYYPTVDFAMLFATGRTCTVGGTKAVTFNDEEMLHYLYQHAFRAPLTYEPYKLINVADITGFIENHFTSLDWQKLKERYPILVKALPLMHHITPWDFAKIPEDFVPAPDKRRKLTPTPFHGWPQKRRQEFRAEKSPLFRVILDTFLPPRWWVGIYYGTTTKIGYLWCLLLKHPLHIAWWVRLMRALQ